VSEENGMKISIVATKFSNFIDRWWRSIARQLTICCCAVVITFALSGCVKYETGINFYGINDGEIIERIQLGEQLKSFSQTAVRSWLDSIEQRTKLAEGRIERSSDRDLRVIIPFHNARDLTTKINRYFNPDPASTGTKSQFNSHLHIDQNNFFLVIRHHLSYEIDLRSLAVKTTDRNLTNSVELDFSLSSPWGVKSSDPGASPTATTDRQISWQLQPGQLNQIDAIFWLPNPLGIGAIVIVILSLGGYYLKYRQLPLQRSVK
jgi:Protein of unknown function (DUF3153)